jgi:hypothetical protein
MKRKEAIEAVKKIHTYAPRPTQLKVFLVRFLGDLGFSVDDPLVVNFNEDNVVTINGKFYIILDMNLSKKTNRLFPQKNEVVTNGLVWIFEDEKLTLERDWKKLIAKLKSINT